MAKLLSYYRLCPLIDTKNLLGISEDSEKGVVIVTLGKNIAIKYRLSDQKQICSWRTKEKFSSPVFYDKNLEKYVAVFNQMFIRVWTEDEESLDKVKKYRFNQSIHTIIMHNGIAFVVFKCGSMHPLSEILETRKSFSPAKIIDEEIYDIVFISLDEDLYIGLLVEQEEGFMFHWAVYAYYSKNVFSKSFLCIDGATLKGYSLFANNKSVSLLTVWSNGKIYTKDLISQNKETSIGDLFTVLENISTQHFVKVVPLDDKYIAIYGSDPNEEGAILLIYNTQFKINQSKQIHKLYTDEAKIWKTFNSILLPVGQNLVVVPFCLESEQLVALIGSHKPVQNKIDADIAFVTDFEVTNWNEDGHAIGGNTSTKMSKKKKKAIKMNRQIIKGKQIPSSLESRLEELSKEGLPEAVIIEQLIPEILEEGNVALLEDSLKFFTDIPEKFLAKILQFALSCDKMQFMDVDEQVYENLPEELLPNQRISLLDIVFAIQFSDILLLPYLRSLLSVDDATLLLQYIVYQLSEDGHNLPSLDAFRTEKCLINWASLIIDSNYQKFVLSKDSKIEAVLVKCKNLIEEHLDTLDSLKTVVPALTRFAAEMKGKSYNNGRLANGLYSLEQISY